MQMQMNIRIPQPMPSDRGCSHLQMGAAALERAAATFLQSAAKVGLDDPSTIEIEYAGQSSPYRHVEGCRFLGDDVLLNLPHARIAESIARTMISTGMARETTNATYHSARSVFAR